MCIGNLFSKPKTPPPPPVPNAPTPPPPPQETQVAPTPLPEAPTPAPTDTAKKGGKAEVTTKQTSKKTTSKGTAGLAVEKAEGTGLQGTGTQQGLNLGTIAEAKAAPTPGTKKGTKKTGGNY